MPPIGQNVITINGKAIKAQGIARIRDGVTTDDAAAKARTAGEDEMIVSYNDADGNKQRLLVWGDHMNFSFRHKESEPDVQVNGTKAMIVSFDDEPNTIWEGAMAGMIQGVKDSCDAISTMAKASIQGVAVTSGAALLGGSIWAAASGGTATQFIMGAVRIVWSRPRHRGGRGVAECGGSGAIDRPDPRGFQFTEPTAQVRDLRVDHRRQGDGARRAEGPRSSGDPAGRSFGQQRRTVRKCRPDRHAACGQQAVREHAGRSRGSGGSGGRHAVGALERAVRPGPFSSKLVAPTKLAPAAPVQPRRFLLGSLLTDDAK